MWYWNQGTGTKAGALVGALSTSMTFVFTILNREKFLKGDNLSPLENKGTLGDRTAGEGSLASYQYRAISCDGD